jgi:hypothetical protein
LKHKDKVAPIRKVFLSLDQLALSAKRASLVWLGNESFSAAASDWISQGRMIGHQGAHRISCIRRWLSEFTKAHFGTLVREQPARRNPLFPRLFFCGLSQAYARTAAVFVDEFDAGGF